MEMPLKVKGLERWVSTRCPERISDAALLRGRLFAKLLSDAYRAAGKMNHFSDSHRGEHG